jgi:hypothetical protein
VFRIRTVTVGNECGNGVLDIGEACDYRLDCCCSVNCGIQKKGVICRDSSGLVCDANDVCDGISPTCTDDFKAAGIECRAKNGDCDIAESCTGTGPECPPNMVLPPGTVCRPAYPAGNTCDVQEVCDGFSPLCPPDKHLSPGSACTPVLLQSELPCVVSGSCDASNECKATFLTDGSACGNFCDNSTCVQGACTPKSSQHPCGSPDFCDASKVGHECTQCGDGVVQPWEECDAGVALKRGPTDGCTQYCQRECEQSRPCAQPLLATLENGECSPSKACGPRRGLS